ncbi:MAG: DUF547 domain-containing protein [Pseudomonadota bacterium]
MHSRSTFRNTLLAAGLALALTTPATVADTPDATPYAQFAAHSETSTYTVRYQPIQQFTTAFGNEERGRMKIAYSALNQQGERFLTQYVTYLSQVPVSTLSRDDQLAFWLNTRNMLIVKAMADSRSRRNVKRNRGTADEPGAMWTEKRVTIDGVELSIDDIEHNIILANWSDTPNVIYGLYQGSQGGIAFPTDGFTGANVHSELEEMGRTFVNARTGVRVRRNKAQLPEIYSWYSDELFGGDQAAIISHVSGLAKDSTATKLASITTFENRKFSYSSDEFIIRQQAAPPGSFGGGGVGGGGGGS